MHGDVECPFTHRTCRKKRCEWWDEYEHECVINTVARFLRRIESRSIE